MARPENKQETQTLSITLPKAAYGYLAHLARNSMLGATENDVAVRLLTDRLLELSQQKFHDEKAPQG
jgi:hypothetical protein